MINEFIEDKSRDQMNEARLSRDIRNLLHDSKCGFEVIEIHQYPVVGIVMHIVGPTIEPYMITIKALPKTAHNPVD